MKKTINYEKDIIFKTHIAEITTISLEHDLTIDEKTLKGDFILSGEYKASELSINKEGFNFKLPIEYELEKNVDIDSINYDIENFEYNINDDVLNIYIEFGIRYNEKAMVPIIPEISEEELNSEDDDLYRPIIEEERIELPMLKSEKKNDKEGEMTILDSLKENDDYVTYHVHIVREGETLETIASMYKTTCEMIKQYNNIEIMELKSKLIIPENVNE